LITGYNDRIDTRFVINGLFCVYMSTFELNIAVNDFLLQT